MAMPSIAIDRVNLNAEYKQVPYKTGVATEYVISVEKDQQKIAVVKPNTDGYWRPEVKDGLIVMSKPFPTLKTKVPKDDNIHYECGILAREDDTVTYSFGNQPKTGVCRGPSKLYIDALVGVAREGEAAQPGYWRI